MTVSANGCRIDVADIKARCRGRWPEVLAAVCGIDRQLLDGRNHPCPLCGGTDRFRMIDAEAGALFCNQCFGRNNGDGIAAVQWLQGVGFRTACERITNYLHISPTHGCELGSNGMTPGKSRTSRRFGSCEEATTATKQMDKQPAELQFHDQFEPLPDAVQDEFRQEFAKSKPPVTAEAVAATGAIAVNWPKNSRGDNRCMAIPAVDGYGKIRGYILRRVDGEDFPPLGKLQRRKTHMLRDSGDGWVIPGGIDRLRQAKTVWRVEGVPDALALYSLLPDDQAVITNICGAKAVPPFLEPFRDKTVYIIGDADQPGQDGAERYANRLSPIAASVRLVTLPFETIDNHGKDLRDYLLAGGTFADLQALADTAEPWEPSLDDQGPDDDGRPEIVIGCDEHRVIDEAVDALSADPDLYHRGGQLVTIIHEDDKRGGIDRLAASARILALQPATIRERLTRFSRLMDCNRNRELVPAHPPDWLIKAIFHRGRWPGVRPLNGIVTTPMMRSDGSILTAPGYDRATGLYLDSAGLLIDVPDCPTRDEAVEAGRDLLDVFRDFPFEQNYHRSALLAMILTVFARSAFSGPSPLFAIDANVRGSGKSLIADAFGVIITGNDLPRMCNPHDDDEARKRITSLAVRGDPVCLIDNIHGELGGAALDAALTGTRWQDRILGRSEVVDMPLEITWLATGNNILYAADTSRRVCHIRLNSREERPEERQGFTYPNLRRHVRDSRAKLLRAALIILRGFHVAERPQLPLPGWGSFEGWSALVRQAVVWLGMTDPAAGRVEMMDRSDTQATALRQLIEAWQEIDPDGAGVTTSELLKMLDRDRDRYPATREALLELCGGSPDKLPTVQAVGNKLKHIRGRIIGGRKLHSRQNRSKQQVWRVVSAECAESAESAESASSPSA